MTELTRWRIPRESTEWVGPITVTVNGTPATTFDVALTPIRTRPTTWAAPTMIGTQAGVMATGLAPDIYTIWAKVTDDPEVVVLEVGIVEVT